jgi:GH25 family lysozyme M1 (1,4-beta-N-acetylmuramidase)
VALTGVDCSRHQGTVNWAAVRAAGHQFAILKLTDSTAYAYAFWGRENIPKARAAGLIVGAYHWLDAYPSGAPKDPVGQARYFVDQINASGGPKDLIAVVDVEVERNSAGTVVSLPKIDSVRAFANEFHRLLPGKTLLIYTGRWYWRDMIGNPNGADIGPLWHSEYETSSSEIADGPEMDVYGGWPGCTIWQYTSTGSVPGVGGNCDVNQFFGTRADLLALAGTTSEEDDFMAALTEAEQRRILKTCDVLYQALDFPGQMDDWSGNMPGRVDRIDGNVAGLPAKIAALATAIGNIDTVDEDALAQALADADVVDEDAVAEAVLAALTPDAIAGRVVELLVPQLPTGSVDVEALRGLVDSAVRDVVGDIRLTAPA